MAKVEKDIKELQNNIIEIKSMLEGQAKETSGKVQKESAKAQISIKDLAREFGKNAGEIFSQSKDSLNENADKFRKKVSEKPIRNTLIAVGAGALITSILKK